MSCAVVQALSLCRSLRGLSRAVSISCSRQDVSPVSSRPGGHSRPLSTNEGCGQADDVDPDNCVVRTERSSLTLLTVNGSYIWGPKTHKSSQSCGKTGTVRESRTFHRLEPKIKHYLCCLNLECIQRATDKAIGLSILLYLLCALSNANIVRLPSAWLKSENRVFLDEQGEK